MAEKGMMSAYEDAEFHAPRHLRIPIAIRLLFLVAATAFFGELKMNPLGSSFRFSLGTACFFFGLVWYPKMPALFGGVVTGFSIVGFRVMLDVLFGRMPYSVSLITHLPSALFYIVFALVIQLFSNHKKMDHPLWMAMAGTLGEVTGNFSELFLRTLFHEAYPITFRTIAIITLFGVLRAFFVVGIFYALTDREQRAAREQQQKRIDSLLLVNSGLFEEVVFINKSMVNIEEVTRKSYELYRSLKENRQSDDAPALALRLAQQIHELKKDSQRILAGLAKIMKTDELRFRLKLKALLQLVGRTNQNYAELLGKQIQIAVNCSLDLETDQIYTLLSILNNIVANAVEAIEKQGMIGIEVNLFEGRVHITVWNTGPEIPPEEMDWIFQVGYTTKFDQSGNPSTGIGLAHVSDLIARLEGNLEVRSHRPQEIDKGVEFVIDIPTKSLLQGGEESWI